MQDVLVNHCLSVYEEVREFKKKRIVIVIIKSNFCLASEIKKTDVVVFSLQFCTSATLTYVITRLSASVKCWASEMTGSVRTVIHAKVLKYIAWALFAIQDFIR